MNKSVNLERFIDLGKQSNGNVFPSLDDLDNEQTFPFVMLFCTDCWQVQLEKFTFPIVYEDAIVEPPDYYLLLSWNFKDFFIEKYANYLKAEASLLFHIQLSKLYEFKVMIQ